MKYYIIETAFDEWVIEFLDIGKPTGRDVRDYYELDNLVYDFEWFQPLLF